MSSPMATCYRNSEHAATGNLQDFDRGGPRALEDDHKERGEQAAGQEKLQRMKPKGIGIRGKHD